MQELDKGSAEIALDSIDDVFYILSIPEGGKLIRWNKAFRDKSGYSDEELKNMTVFDFFDDKGKQRQAEFFVGLLEKGQDILEIEVITKKGEKIPFEFHSTIIKDSASDEPSAVIGIGRDSSQHRDEKRTISTLVLDLQERVKELGCLYEFSKTIETPNMTLESMINKLITILPVAWQFPEITCSKIALDDNEYTEGNWDEVKARQSANLMVNNQERGTVSVGYTEERPDDYEGPFLQEERILLNAMTERLGRVIERIEIRKALERSEEKFRGLTSQLPETVFETNLTGNLTFTNEAGFRTFGYTKEDFEKGVNAFQMIAEEDRERAGNNIAQVIQGEQVGQHEYLGLKNDGTTFPILVSSIPVFENDEVTGMRGVITDITELKHAHNAIEESEKQYRLLAENITDVVWIMELDGFKRVYTSPSVERLRGFTPEEVAEAEPGSFVTPETLQNAYKTLAEELEKDKELGKTDPNRTGMFEVEQSCKDGSTVWTEVTAKFLRDEEGNPTHILGVGRDITDRRKYEEALKSAKEEWERSFNSINEGMFIVDKDLTILRCNNAFKKITGVEDCEGRKCHELIHDSDEPPDYCITCSAMKTKESVKAEIYEPNLKKYIAVSTDPSFDSEGNFEFAIHIIRDITDRKIAELELKESEMRYRDLFENANDLIQSVGSDMKFQYVNKAWRDTLGYTEEEVKELNLMDIIHPDSWEHCVEAFKVVIDGREVSGVQAQFVTKDGRAIDVEGNVNCQVENGIPIATRGIFRDISERKKSEEEIQRINAELKGYAHTVSHDLKSPLTSISMGCEMLTSDLMSEPFTEEKIRDIKETIGIINRGNQKAYELVNRLLALAESGQVPEQVFPVDIKKTVEEVFAENSKIINEKNVTVEVGDYLGYVVADPTQIYQLFANLIRNALKHTRGKLEISYSVDDGRKQFTVKDDGEGIPEEIIDTLFLPFVKGERESAGIGLSIVEKIVGLYGGNIKAYNNNGAVFEFTLKDYEE